MNAPTPAARSARTTTLFLAFGIGTLVSVGLGVYGRLHDATSFAFNLAGFSSRHGGQGLAGDARVRCSRWSSSPRR